ncbi:amidase domain-containing protein [Paenibacillus harenae]|uniref:amidase domain-containing protein n=1 Tax=Paenibacillus harenae TaxID=306543 RepID=UPI00278E340D|nr:amidase domain-containing protein [Paenibacillus harenae]MDQ0062740.1 hypothetical protein [Paenibacillus harenae]
MKRFFTSFTLSLVLVATLVTPIFATPSVKNPEKINPEKIIIEHLKQQGKNYSVGSEDYNMYIHNIPWNVDTSLSKHPEYDELVIYAINYGKENMNKQIIQKDAKAKQDKTELSVQNVVAPMASTALSYNRQQVVNYAYNWTTNGGTKRNTNFDIYQNDCTNFGSQAWNGGGNVMRSQSSVPGGITQTTSYWYSFKRGTSFDVSTSWIRVVDFYGYWSGYRGVITSSYADTAFDKSILRNNAEPGDIVQLSPTGGGDKYHTMVVTKKDANDIYFTYHSGPNNLDVVDKPLAQITGNKFFLLVFGS